MDMTLKPVQVEKPMAFKASVCVTLMCLALVKTPTVRMPLSYQSGFLV